MISVFVRPGSGGQWGLLAGAGALLIVFGVTSLRFSYELEIPGLRVRPVARFPYLVFYIVGEVADVWRILHTRRDVPSAIAGDSPPDPSLG